MMNTIKTLLPRKFNSKPTPAFSSVMNTCLRSVYLLGTALMILSAISPSYGQVEVVLVKDINEGPADAFTGFTMRDAVLHNDLLYFKAFDSEHGEEPWITDGTSAGTAMLKDVNPGAGTVSANSFTSFNDLVFFQADDGLHGRELWVTDGSESGTALFADIDPGEGHASPNSFFVWNDLLYFAANDGVHGEELWVSDGTEAGTFMLKDLRPGSWTSSSRPMGFLSFNGRLFFTADDGVHGEELWSTDGTSSGTSMVADINMTEENESSEPVRLTVFNGELLFLADDGVHGYELWKTDGTGPGTQMVSDVNPGEAGIVFGNFISPPVPFEFNGKLYFGGLVGEPIYRLWETDGTEAGTQQAALPDEEGLKWPGEFTLYNGEMYFSATDDEAGEELWKTDGTPNGTVLVKDIQAGPEMSLPGNFKTYNGRLYFTASDGSNGQELWQTDGSEEGTVKISPDFATQSNPMNMVLNQFREVGGRLLFPAGFADLGTELYAVADATFNTAEYETASIGIFPNPANGMVSVDLSAFDGPVEIEVRNIIGQSIFRIPNAHPEIHRIDVGQWSSGVYFVGVYSDAGRHCERFVKR